MGNLMPTITETGLAMERIYNFSAGPAVLPREVLEQARDELQTLSGFAFDPEIVDVFLKLEIR